MPKKKTEEVEEPETDDIEVEAVDAEDEPPAEPKAEVKPQRRDPTDAQMREAVRQLSPASRKRFQQIVSGSRLGRNRTGKVRL